MLECIDLFPQPLSTQDGLGGKNTLYDVIIITFFITNGSIVCFGKIKIKIMKDGKSKAQTNVEIMKHVCYVYKTMIKE